MTPGTTVRYVGGSIAALRGKTGTVVPLRCQQNREQWVSVDFGPGLGVYDLFGRSVQEREARSVVVNEADWAAHCAMRDAVGHPADPRNSGAK